MLEFHHEHEPESIKFHPSDENTLIPMGKLALLLPSSTTVSNDNFNAIADDPFGLDIKHVTVMDPYGLKEWVKLEHKETLRIYDEKQALYYILLKMVVDNSKSTFNAPTATDRHEGKIKASTAKSAKAKERLLKKKMARESSILKRQKVGWG
jgi:predicted ATP-binding protein involved in virulence